VAHGDGISAGWDAAGGGLELTGPHGSTGMAWPPGLMDGDGWRGCRGCGLAIRIFKRFR
jgi:hypothetical protein